MAIKHWICRELRRGTRLQGSELQLEDVGRNLGQSFGPVLRIDVGKRVWLGTTGHLVMESCYQRDDRKADPLEPTRAAKRKAINEACEALRAKLATMQELLAQLQLHASA